jgi:hypothetical protein
MGIRKLIPQIRNNLKLLGLLLIDNVLEIVLDLVGFLVNS